MAAKEWHWKLRTHWGQATCKQCNPSPIRSSQDSTHKYQTYLISTQKSGIRTRTGDSLKTPLSSYNNIKSPNTQHIKLPRPMCRSTASHLRNQENTKRSIESLIHVIYLPASKLDRKTKNHGGTPDSLIEKYNHITNDHRFNIAENWDVKCRSSSENDVPVEVSSPLAGIGRIIETAFDQSIKSPLRFDQDGLLLLASMLPEIDDDEGRRWETMVETEEEGGTITHGYPPSS